MILVRSFSFKDWCYHYMGFELDGNTIQVDEDLHHTIPDVAKSDYASLFFCIVLAVCSILNVDRASSQPRLKKQYAIAVMTSHNPPRYCELLPQVGDKATDAERGDSSFNLQVFIAASLSRPTTSSSSFYRPRKTTSPTL